MSNTEQLKTLVERQMKEIEKLKNATGRFNAKAHLKHWIEQMKEEHEYTEQSQIIQYLRGIEKALNG